MFDLKEYQKLELPSERNFGLILSILFLAIGFYPLINGTDLLLWPLLIGLALLILAFFSPSILVIPNYVWFKFGLMIGAIVSPIILIFVYFTTVLPTGVLIKLMNKDLLRLKLDKTAKSYWIERIEQNSSMRDQF
jgi:hypothetical protein